MPTLPCANKFACSPCGDGNPKTNFSSAAPDVPTFTGIKFISLLPPLGTDWLGFGCRTVCESQVSQEAADLCAAAGGLTCAAATWLNPVNGPGGNPVPPVPPPQGSHGGRPFPMFSNTEQTGQAFCPDDFVFNFKQPARTFVGFTQAQANAAALSYANRQAELRMICLSDLPSPVCVDSAYNHTITATGSFLAVAPQADNWEIIAGMLPPGLTFHGGMITGGQASITGTANTPGTYDFTVSITEPNGDSQQKNYIVKVAGVTNALSIPDGTVGVAYSFQMESTGFIDPIFSVDVLPDGLAMDENGLITGTPTMEQTVVSTFGVSEGGIGLECTTDGSIEVIGGGINFNDIVWGAPNFSPGDPPPGTGSASGSQNSASADATHEQTAGSGAGAHITGTIDWNGVQQNCNVLVNVTLADGDPSNGAFQINISSALVGLLVFHNLFNPGTNNYAFIIPDTGGMVDTITIKISASAVAFDSDATISGNITVTPAF